MFEVSVIIPIYNGAAFLAETIDSILASTLKNIQIILVDDGSTDKSPDICKEYQEKSSNIIYYHKENGGIVSARNVGLTLAEGEFVCFCDQDDFVNSQMYEILLKAIECNHCEVGLCGTARYIKGESIVAEQFDDELFLEENIKKEIVEPVLFYGTSYGKAPLDRRVGSIWKLMVKKEFILEREIKFRRYVDYEDDLLFFLDVLTHAKRVCTVSYIGYNWRINLGSETYNWKYIKGFKEKYFSFIDDIERLLISTNFDNETIENFKNYQLCTMYEQLILNEGSYYNKRSFADKISYIKNFYYSFDFKRILVFRKKILRTSIRKKICLNFLAFRLWIPAYLWTVWYKKIRERLIKGKSWFYIENLIKTRISENHKTRAKKER